MVLCRNLTKRHLYSVLKLNKSNFMQRHKKRNELRREEPMSKSRNIKAWNANMDVCGLSSMYKFNAHLLGVNTHDRKEIKSISSRRFS